MRCCGWRVRIARRRSSITLVPRTQCSMKRCAAEPGPTLVIAASMGPGSAEQRAITLHRVRDTLTPIGYSHEPPSPPQRPPCGRQAGSRRADRRRKIRLDVPVAGAAYAGLEVSVIIDLDRDRAREACRTVGWDAGADRANRLHRRRRARDRRRRDGRRGGSDRQSRRRHPACPRRDCGGQACRDGQCRGRRAGRPAAGRGSPQGRRGLFAGLWRPAGADRRNGGLGARDRVSRRRRRQGHKISAGLS